MQPRQSQASPALQPAHRRTHASGAGYLKRADGENIALVKAMGSKRGYAPIPPAQFEWQSEPGEPPLYRLWSWMCRHTIDLDKKSPYALRDDGRAATLKDAAKDLGLDLGHVSNLWKWGTSKHLWHRNGGRELYLNGEVKGADVRRANKERTDSVHSTLRPVELAAMEGWPKDRREKFLEIWGEAQKHHRALLAAKVSEVRASCGQMDDNIREIFSLPKKGFKVRVPAQVADIPPLISELLSTVHSTPVQPTPDECTHGENGGENMTVPTATSLFSSENTREEWAAAAYSGTPAEVEAVASALKMDTAAAVKLLRKCRLKTAAITVAEVLELAGSVRGGKVSNRVGLLLTAVPNKANGEPLAMARAAIRQREAAAIAAEERAARESEAWLNATGETLESAIEMLQNHGADPSQHQVGMEILQQIAASSRVSPACRDRAAAFLLHYAVD